MLRDNVRSFLKLCKSNFLVHPNTHCSQLFSMRVMDVTFSPLHTCKVRKKGLYARY
jgi:hypothetical protein